VFAESYIHDVVDDLVTAWNPDSNDKQLRWTIDPLSEYFDTVEQTEVVAEAESKFTNSVLPKQRNQLN